MVWFMIRVEGEGLNVNLPGEFPILWGLFSVKRILTITGFYATRYVEAEDAGAAIELVRSVVAEDLAEVLARSSGSRDRFVLRVDSITAVDPKDVDANAKGFTFFNE